MCTTGAAPESLFTVELYCAVELWKEVQFVEDQLDSIELKAAAILINHCQQNQQLRYYEDICPDIDIKNIASGYWHRELCGSTLTPLLATKPTIQIL